jgi:tetratricopeptide (TPR) repeat protein
MSQPQSRKERYAAVNEAADADDHALAILRARRFVADFPDASFVWFLLGEALVALARYEEADVALAKAAETCAPKSLRVVYSRWGQRFDSSGDYEAAKGWYRKLIEDSPHDTMGYILLGSVLAKQGRLREAEDTHRAGTRCAEGDVDEAYLNLGYVLRAQERFAEAAECFREALRRDPDYRHAKDALKDVTACLAELERA